MFTPEEATQAVMSFLGVRPAPPPGDERDEWIKQELEFPTTVPTEKLDYTLQTPDSTNPPLPFSWTQIQNEEQAYAWYKYKHPQYPDDVLRVMASGWRPTPPVVTSPRRKKTVSEFSVEQGEVEVDFG